MNATNDMIYRANSLGKTYSEMNTNESICEVRHPLRLRSIDTAKFCENIVAADDLWKESGDIDTFCAKIENALYEAATLSECNQEITFEGLSPPINATERWNRILRYQDPKALWKAIDWSGSFQATPDIQGTPTDKQFCKHYEKLLNPPGPQDGVLNEPQEEKYVPVLDDEITPNELEAQIKKLHADKAPGCDGIWSGLLKHLCDDWIILLTFLFNTVFLGGYPNAWNLIKVFNIYKKGPRLDTGNYRGISLMSTLPKLYDMILSARFGLWYTPHQEQAGGQMGRGCEEQILIVRLLIDIARKTKRCLYIAFIDYQKAYDKLNRRKLLEMLDKKGCGSRFLQAIQQSMQRSTGVIGSETFEATSGVKQGASSSCPLFTFYIDYTVEAVCQEGEDDWLQNLHMVLFMDDTVIFATSRKKMQRKLAGLKEAADHIDMIIHPTKSEYISVNGQGTDSFIIDGATIMYAEQYVYLGSTLMNDTVAKQVQAHVDKKHAHSLKFSSFLMKNSDAPFTVKETVFRSAVMAAFLYSSETWMTSDLRAVERPYMRALKELLGVRETTCNDLVLIEAGVGDAKSVIKQKQIKFLTKIFGREDYSESLIKVPFPKPSNIERLWANGYRTIIRRMLLGIQ